MRCVELISLLLACTLSVSDVLASSTLLGDLEPGPWHVGFSVVDTLDSSRGFVARHDIDGHPADHETARPMRLFIWYPADSTDDAPITYRYYREVVAGAGATDEQVEALIQSERALVSRMTKHEFTDAGWDSIMSRQTLARVAPPRADRVFPVILSCANARRNTVLFEYLASHGYVVVSVPLKGKFTEQAIEFTPNPVSIEAGVQDLQFAYAFLRSLPDIDLNRLGMWMFSSLSIYSLEFQCRNMAARAMLHVEGWEAFKRGREIIEKSAFYDPAAIRIPYMLLKKEKEESNPTYANDSWVFDSLRYANRYRVFMSGMEHGDFNSETISTYATDGVRARYDTVCRTTLAFYDAYLNDDAGAAERLDALLESYTPSMIRFDHLSPALAPPTESELVAAFEVGDSTQMRAVARITKILDMGMDLPYRESVINRLGYRILHERPADAPVIFDIMTRAFPTSANAWDSKSDAYESLGQNDAALEAATKALELLPQDKSLSNDQRERLEIDLRNKLRRFRGN